MISFSNQSNWVLRGAWNGFDYYFIAGAGKLHTNAHWMRNFVRDHPSYKHDSRFNRSGIASPSFASLLLFGNRHLKRFTKTSRTAGAIFLQRENSRLSLGKILNQQPKRLKNKQTKKLKSKPCFSCVSMFYLLLSQATHVSSVGAYQCSQ